MLFRPGEELVVGPPGVNPEQFDGSPGARVLMRIRQGDAESQVRFAFSNIDIADPPLALEAGVALALLPAMKLGSTLRIAGEIDRELLHNLDRFQEVFAAWYPEYRRVPVVAEGTVDRSYPDASGRGVGVFYSGGMDSTYSLVKNEPEITHAIFLHGADIPLTDTTYRERTSRHLREATAAFGVKLIELETDLLAFSDQYAHWGYHYHGCGLVAIAMLLSSQLQKVFIAASDNIKKVGPWGSTMITDPLWSTGGMQIEVDGFDQTRLGKTQVIVDDGRALPHLRVCFGTPAEGLNCGRCEKCFRNMVALRLCGGLDRCTAFNCPLDLGAMVRSDALIREAMEIETWRVARDEAERQGDDPELIAALREVNGRMESMGIVRRLARRKRDIVASPEWRNSLPKFRGALLGSLVEEDPDWFAGEALKRLPKFREQAFAGLWKRHRRWLRRQYRSASLARIKERLKRALGRR